MEIFSVSGLFLHGLRPPGLYHGIFGWEGRGRMSHESGEPAVSTADDLAEASGCLHHPFIKVFGEAKWQEANVPPSESDVSGDLSGRTSLCSLPSPHLPLPPPRPCALPPSPSRGEVRRRPVSFSGLLIHQGTGEESAEIKREGIRLLPREGLPQLPDSFISPGFRNIPFILMCCLLMKYC